MLQSLKHVVAVLLVVMHAVAGRAAGSVVCLGGAGCGPGHVPSMAPAEPAGHSHRHDHGRAHDGGHWHAGPTGCSHGVGAAVDREHRDDGTPVERDGHEDNCSCIDVWMPDGRIEDGRTGFGGMPDTAALLLERVERVVGGVHERRPERAADQWPPGVDPGIRCTILVI